jgi:pimeloyl-ACP methyl ester carboxylesterase
MVLIHMAPPSSLSDVALPFHPGDSSFNRTNALYLAHASEIAYDRAPAAAASRRLGLKTVAFHHKVVRTRGFFGVCDTHAVLAFRGTDPVTLPSWLADVVAKLVDRAEYNGRVHQGFSSVLRRTWRTIETILHEVQDKPLFLTGHSMGGALSVLAACRLAKIGRPPAAVYTFGAPRVGDLTFCAGYGLPTYRIVNCLDIVPELPLASLKRLLPEKSPFVSEKVLDKFTQMADRAGYYGHVKMLVYIDRDGVITPDAHVAPWHAQTVAQAIATHGKSYLQGVKDHLISNYIRSLGGQISRKRADARRGNGHD